MGKGEVKARYERLERETLLHKRIGVALPAIEPIDGPDWPHTYHTCQQCKRPRCNGHLEPALPDQ